MTPKPDHQPVTISFFWWRSRFGQCFGGSSLSNHCDERLRERLLRERRERHASSLRFFCTSVNSCGIHWSSFFTLPIESRLFALIHCTLMIIHMHFGWNSLLQWLSGRHYPPESWVDHVVH
ncbi:hypothetical protein NPIL_534851 [Nephila pilipes]|uniref:Uncharacterized protein n=1 Tax=Nephila pilipes TaxID=299642 RepID=A0A8X6PKY3_NEPPI|nr:hypothetical protein NPIL_534851 [Nephila pilipes]